MLLVASPAEEAWAQIPQGVEGTFRPHPEAREAISRLYSPYCPGFMLEVCTSREAMTLRDTMQALALQGRTSDELVDWMLAEYGHEYLAVPHRRGSGLWAWLLPPGALVAGLFLVMVALRRFRGPEEEAEASAESDAEAVVSSDAEERLREAIREMELSEDPSF
jgi:cytochrome c-type biogenesis protein CcmH